MKDIKLEFELRLNIDEFGKYKKGDLMKQIIPVLDENTGLVRFSIDKKWDIISVKEIEKPYKSIDEFIFDNELKKQETPKGIWFHYGDVIKMLKKIRTADVDGKRTIEVPSDRYDEILNILEKSEKK